MSERPRLPVGMTPRLLSRDAAAAYCGMSPDSFEMAVPVRPVNLNVRRRLWDVKALDRWLDHQSGLVEALPSPDEWLGRLRDDSKSARR